VVCQPGKYGPEQKTNRHFVANFKQRQPRQDVSKNIGGPPQGICLHLNPSPFQLMGHPLKTSSSIS